MKLGQPNVKCAKAREASGTVVTAWVSCETKRLLDAEAGKRGMGRSKFAARVLGAAVRKLSGVNDGRA